MLHRLCSSLLLLTLALSSMAQVKVAVFSINDFHSAFVRNDYRGVPGAPALWHTLDSLKRVYPYHVTLSAGDNFGGSYFNTATKGCLMPEFFRDLDIRVSALGNHEFDEGQRALESKWGRITGADAPLDLTYVCANVRNAKQGGVPSFAQPVASVPITLKGGKQLRVAIAGLLTSMTPMQASVRNLSGLVFDGRYDQALDSLMMLPEASLLNDAAVRILLTHIGTKMTRDSLPAWDDRDAAHLDAIRTDTWDGIVTSHTHQLVDGFINDKAYPVVQALCQGKYIGMLLCTVDTATMRVTRVEPQLIEVRQPKQLEDGPARLQARIDSVLTNTKTAGGTAIGEQLAFASHDMPHDRLRRMQQTEVGSLVCRSYAEAYRTLANLPGKAPIIGVSHFGSIRSGLPQGPISVLDLGEALPFANRLKVYKVTGQQLIDLVKFGLNNVRFGRIQVGNLHINTTASGEVTTLMYDGPQHQRTIIFPKRDYILVADEFMTNGGDGYDPKFFPEEQVLKVEGMPTTTDAFINYLRRLRRI